MHSCEGVTGVEGDGPLASPRPPLLPETRNRHPLAQALHAHKTYVMNSQYPEGMAKSLQSPSQLILPETETMGLCEPA